MNEKHHPNKNIQVPHINTHSIMGAAESSNGAPAAAAAAPPPPPTTTTTDPSFPGEQSRQDEEHVHVSLTHAPLDASAQLSLVKSPKAGAVVLFAGCTRDSFSDRPVTHLSYSTYAPLALKTLSRIACHIKRQHHLTAISIVHRLGQVDIGEESILIAVSAPHRKAAWEAGEACLEDVKRQAEIWKEEWFADGGVWRSNRDGQAGVPVRTGSKSEKGKGKERKVSISAVSTSAPTATSAADVLPLTTTTTSRRRKSSAAKGSTTRASMGLKKSATEPAPARPRPITRTTTFYEGGFEI